MIKINENFLNIEEQYLFSEITQEVRNLRNKNQNIKLIDMSIGDVKIPINQDIIEALHRAVDDMGSLERCKGYSPDQGYLFLRKSIQKKYNNLNVDIDLDDIFINDGSKSDLGNILDIFSNDNIVGLQSVCYPVYVDVCKMSGFKITYFKSCELNNFLPMPYDIIGDKPDLIYLCSPNNPTGMAYNRDELCQWVDYALDNNIIIFYDSAYQDFIRDVDIPKTIFKIRGSDKCVIEICSLSKSAGFTGLRLGYTIIPHNITCKINGDNIVINKLWKRRQATKFNGVSYLSQRAGDQFLKNNEYNQHIDHCMCNSEKLSKYLNNKKFTYWGGINSPYIWVKCPNGYSSRDYFKYLIDNFNVISTPGVGFGKDGEGFVRFSTFFR